jgi:hypothetical protein
MEFENSWPSKRKSGGKRSERRSGDDKPVNLKTQHFCLFGCRESLDVGVRRVKGKGFRFDRKCWQKRAREVKGKVGRDEWREQSCVLDLKWKRFERVNSAANQSEPNAIQLRALSRSNRKWEEVRPEVARSNKKKQKKTTTNSVLELLMRAEVRMKQNHWTSRVWEACKDESVGNRFTIRPSKAKWRAPTVTDKAIYDKDTQDDPRRNVSAVWGGSTTD